MSTHGIASKPQRLSLLALAIASGLCSLSVRAQQADTAQDKPQDRQPTTLETVTVTAQGREQDILDVPYNISAVSGDDIEQGNILDNSELLRGVAGVTVVDRGARNSSVVSGIRIRGLNVDSSALGDYAVSAAATVATYVDNTPLFANFLLSDIDRVEVLRGPQGTLYGSGSLGGTVRYILRKPDPSGFSGRVSYSLSSVEGSGGIGQSGSLTLNVPLSGTAALRFNGTVNDYPGVTDYRNVYVLDNNGIPVAPNGVLSPAAQYENRRDADFARQDYGRIALFWQPSDRFDMTLSYTAQADSFGGRRGTSEGTDGWGIPYRRNEIGSVQLEPSRRHVNLASLEANVNLGFATLTSSTSHYSHKGDILSENTGFYAMNGWLGAFYYNYPRPLASAVRSYSDKAFIEELRLVSNENERFDYVLGLYYQRQDRTSSQDSMLRGFKQWWDAAYPAYSAAVISDRDFLYRNRERYTETAFYGEGTWHITPAVDLTLGLRSFHNRDVSDVFQTTGLWAGIVDSSTSHGNVSDSRTLFKGTLSWRFAERNQLYATISEGYRRGGTNGTPPTGNFAENPAWTTYRADSVRNYEIGVKGTAGGVTYNADIFYVDWKNPQVNSSTPLWGFFAVQNAQKASTRGVELEIAGSVGPAFGYMLGYTYTDARLDADAVAADGSYVYGLKGMALPGAPRHRFNAAANYNIALGSGWLVLRADGYYQSSTQNAMSLSPKFQRTLKGFAIFNLSATYSQGDWDATLWLKNVGDVAGVTGIYTAAYMGTSPAQNYFGNGSKMLDTLPRTLGMTVSYRF